MQGNKAREVVFEAADWPLKRCKTPKPPHPTQPGGQIQHWVVVQICIILELSIHVFGAKESTPWRSANLRCIQQVGVWGILRQTVVPVAMAGIITANAHHHQWANTNSVTQGVVRLNSASSVWQCGSGRKGVHVSSEKIKTLGRWESSAYLLYVRLSRKDLSSISTLISTN